MCVTFCIRKSEMEDNKIYIIYMCINITTLSRWWRDPQNTYIEIHTTLTSEDMKPELIWFIHKAMYRFFVSECCETITHLLYYIDFTWSYLKTIPPLEHANKKLKIEKGSHFTQGHVVVSSCCPQIPILRSTDLLKNISSNVKHFSCTFLPMLYFWPSYSILENWYKAFLNEGKMSEEKTEYYTVNWELDFIHTCMCFCQNLFAYNMAGTVMMRDESYILYPPEALDAAEYHLRLRSLESFISRNWQNWSLSFCLLGNLVFHFSGIYSLAVLLEQGGRGKSKTMDHDLFQAYV